jgi:hypothetical protein
VVGTIVRGGRHFTVPIKHLRMHTAMVGAAGSGKTLLLKRMIELCVMRGVSTMVLEPNDGLVRLDRPGRAHRPDRPTTMSARRHVADIQVMVWTPDLNRGHQFLSTASRLIPVFSDENDLRQSEL